MNKNCSTVLNSSLKPIFLGNPSRLICVPRKLIISDIIGMSLHFHILNTIFTTSYLKQNYSNNFRGFNRRCRQLANFAASFPNHCHLLSILTSFELLLLLNQYLVLNFIECRKLHFRASRFQNFLGQHTPRPLLGEGPYSQL